MDYCKFKNIFNEIIFENSKKKLIEKIAQNPGRYSGLFRPTKPKAKIIQNLSQSHEIKFGDAFEKLIECYLEEFGFSNLEKNISIEGKKKLMLDQLFSDKESVFLMEQKMRDDHDSTKKRGQIDNFEKKIKHICEKYSEKKIVGFFYFIDDNFKKNYNFYVEEIKKLSLRYKINLHLVYGKELFSKLKKENIWDEIINHLENWRQSIPDLPQVNFDINPEQSFDELKTISPALFKKLFSNYKLNEILKNLFPENKTLNLLHQHFVEKCNQGENSYQKVQELCLKTINLLEKI